MRSRIPASLCLLMGLFAFATSAASYAPFATYRSGGSAAAAAMGGTGTIALSHADAFLANSAAVARTPGIRGSATTFDTFGVGMSHHYAGLSVTVGGVGLAAGWDSVSIRSVAIDELGHAGEEFVWTESVFIGTASASLPFTISVGLAAKGYMASTGLGEELFVVAFDAGVIAQPLESLVLGASLADVGGTPLQWIEAVTNEIPQTLKLEASLSLLDGLLRLVAGFDLPSLAMGTARFGIEVAPVEWLAIRAGMAIQKLSFDDWFSFGLGLEAGFVTLNAAYQIHRSLGGRYILSAGLTLLPPKQISAAPSS